MQLSCHLIHPQKTQQNHYYLLEMQMDPNSIELNNLSKIFEYEKISREVDNCENIEDLKNICKCYIKLYFKQQEVVRDLKIFSPE